MVVLKSTKAQIKIFETIGVLIVFFFLLIISFVFYMNYQKAQFQRELEQKAVLASTEIASKSFLMPEFDCSVVGVKIPNCYDKFKLMSMEALRRSDSVNIFRNYYFNFFGLASIKVKNLYDRKEYIIYDIQLSGKESKKNVYRTFVCLQDPVSRVCSFGVVEVATYVER